jgi:hypothetical protein
LDKAGGVGLRCREDPATAGPLQRLANTNQAGQEPGGASLGNDPAPGLYESETRVHARDAQVRGQHDACANPDRVAINRRYYRFATGEDAQRDDAAPVPARIDPRLRIGRLAEGSLAFEFGAGTERAASACDDDRLDFVRGVGILQQSDEVTPISRVIALRRSGRLNVTVRMESLSSDSMDSLAGTTLAAMLPPGDTDHPCPDMHA